MALKNVLNSACFLQIPCNPRVEIIEGHVIGDYGDFIIDILGRVGLKRLRKPGGEKTFD
jgi:hypothetical protein